MRSLVFVLVALAGVAWGETVERIVAQVNGEIITLTEWEDMIEAAVSGDRQGDSVPEREKVGEQVLERMIADRLIVQAAGVNGLKVTETEVEPQVDQELEALKQRFATQKAFHAQLKKEGITYEDLRHRYTRRMMDRFLYMKMINRKRRQLEAEAEVDENEIRRYYDEYRGKGEWMTEPEVRARHIQFSVEPSLKGAERKAALERARQRARAAEAALKRGEPFEDVAAKLSEDILTRDQGGDLGRFSRNTYHEAIEKAAFSLKPGEVSRPVESPVGLHLIMVERAFEPRPKGLDDPVTPPPSLQDDPAAGPVSLRLFIRAILRNQKMSESLQAWVDELKENALIQRFPAPERDG